MSLEPPFSQRAAAVMAALRAMDDVPDAPHRAVFLCGLPGTGKSTLAGLAAARLGLPAFSFDWFLGARFIGVECVCPDETAHRGRVEARGRDIPGWPATVTWEHVGRMRARWEPRDEPHLVLDTLQPAQASVDRIVEAVSAP